MSKNIVKDINKENDGKDVKLTATAAVELAEAETEADIAKNK